MAAINTLSLVGRRKPEPVRIVHAQRSPAHIEHARNAQKRKRDQVEQDRICAERDEANRKLNLITATFTGAAKAVGHKMCRVGGNKKEVTYDEANTLIHAACQRRIPDSIGINIDRLYAVMYGLVINGELQGFIRVLSALADWKRSNDGAPLSRSFTTINSMEPSSQLAITRICGLAN